MMFSKWNPKPGKVTLRPVAVQRALLWGMVCLGMWWTTTPAQAFVRLPNPRLVRVSPAGGQHGTTFTVDISGADLDDPTELIFSHPGITAERKMLPPQPYEPGPQPDGNRFEVTIAPDVPPGKYEVRVRGRFGLSSCRLFAVSDLPEVASDLKNKSLEAAMPLELNSIVNCAAASGDSEHYYRFEAKAGQPILIRCETRSIDSGMVGMVELLNSDGNPIAFGRTTNYREPVIAFVPSGDGTFYIKVYEATYESGAQNYYRLELSTRPFIEGIWPLSGMPGTKGTYTIYGYNLPGGKPAAGFDAKYGLEELQVEIELPKEPQPFCQTLASTIRELHEVETNGFEYRLPGALPSHPVFLSAAVAPVVIEQEPNNTAAEAQNVTLPVEMSGRFFPSQGSDWFSFEGVKGKTYSIQVYSERLGLPTDPVLVVESVERDPEGKEKVQIVNEFDDPQSSYNNAPFDRVTHDAALTFTAKTDGKYRVQVRDLYAGANSHPRNVYRMVIREARPDFELVVTAKELVDASSLQDPQMPTTPVLRQGGSQMLVVQAYRRDGFDGPVELTVEDLPAGVSCPPVTIPAGQSQANLVLTADSDAPASVATFRVWGTADINGQQVRHEAQGATVIWDKTAFASIGFSRVMRNMAVAVLPEKSLLVITPEENRVWEMARGGKLPIKAHFDRHSEITGSLKLQVRGLPVDLYPHNRIPTATLDSKVTEGEVTVDVSSKLPPGEYPCLLTVQTKAKYVWNPDAPKIAEEKIAALEKYVDELTTAAQDAKSTLMAAAKKVDQIAASEESTEKAESLKAAEAEKMQAAAAVSQAEEALKQGKQLLQQQKPQLERMANEAKPKDIDLFVASRPLVIKVHEMPMDLTIPETLVIKQGGEAEVPVSLERRFEFRDVVHFDAQFPKGVAGLSAARLSVPDSKTEDKLVIKTTRDTPPGDYQITIRVSWKFNGAALNSDRTLDLKVEPSAEVAATPAQ